MAISKTAAVSKALAIQKLAQQKALAPALLPKTRWCARVVLAIASGTDVEESIAVLKAGMGQNWTPAAAFQFMSGKQALFCCGCGADDEKASLLRAQKIAQAVSGQADSGKLSPAELQASAARAATTILL